MANARGCQLYRHWDASGKLLYVGQSLSAIKRLSAHGTSKWFEEIAKVTIQTLPTVAEAKAAELLAIVTENPKYNIVGKGNTKRAYIAPSNTAPLNRRSSYLGGHTLLTQRPGDYESTMAADAIKHRRRAAIEQSRVDAERRRKKQRKIALEEALRTDRSFRSNPSLRPDPFRRSK